MQILYYPSLSVSSFKNIGRRSNQDPLTPSLKSPTNDFDHGSLASFVFQGPVVQSIVSLTSSLRGQLVKCFTT